MFAYLADLSYQRRGRQVLGFYVAYFFILFIVNFPLTISYGVITGQIEGPDAAQAGLRVGTISAAILCTVLASAIVVKKKQLSLKSVSLVLLATGMTLFWGLLGGLIPTANLTMMSKNV